MSNNTHQYQFFLNNQDALQSMISSVREVLPANLNEIIVLCIGTDRSTGDSYGPLVGKMLAEKKLKNVHVYGTLKEPVHAQNLIGTIKEIEEKHANSFIIAIDACLGRLKSVGSITIHEEPMKPGAGLNKNLPAVGDISINGIVNVSGYMEFFVLQNTKLSLVMDMAELTAMSLSIALRSYEFSTPQLV